MARTKRKGFQKLLICLYGRGDSGKSSTLLELAEILRGKATKYIELKKTARSIDKRIVVDALNRTLGIGTFGDTDALIEENIKELDPYGCDIMITASRDRLDRTKIAPTSTSLAVLLKSAAIWNIAKTWPKKLSCGNVINVTGVGELLYYIGEATRTRQPFIDEDKI